jgi:hypothetical protein
MARGSIDADGLRPDLDDTRKDERDNGERSPHRDTSKQTNILPELVLSGPFWLYASPVAGELKWGCNSAR